MCVFYGLCTDPAPPSASVPPALRNYVQKTYNARKEAQRKRQAAKGDAVHNTRWRNTLGPQAVHSGACHCQRVRFRIKSSKTIYAVDVPSKVRFPRVSVPAASFEALTDEAAMSLYAVSTADGHGGMGVHTFCSYCGVHVVYSPSTDPQEIQVRGHVLVRCPSVTCSCRVCWVYFVWTCVVRCPSVTCSCRVCWVYFVWSILQYTDPPPPLPRLLPISHPQVNVDCLDKSNIEQVLVSYMACADSTPVQLSYEPARSFNRRGTGSNNVNVHPPQTQAQAQAQVREFLYYVCAVCCMQCIA